MDVLMRVEMRRIAPEEPAKFCQLMLDLKFNGLRVHEVHYYVK